MASDIKQEVGYKAELSDDGRNDRAFCSDTEKNFLICKRQSFWLDKIRAVLYNINRIVKRLRKNEKTFREGGFWQTIKK